MHAWQQHIPTGIIMACASQEWQSEGPTPTSVDRPSQPGQPKALRKILPNHPAPPLRIGPRLLSGVLAAAAVASSIVCRWFMTNQCRSRPNCHHQKPKGAGGGGHLPKCPTPTGLW